MAANYKILTATIAAVMLFACGIFAHASETENVPDSKSNEGFHEVINPKVPYTFTFAGEIVNLNDVDMYERLDRELTSMIYTHGNTLLTIKRANRYFPLLKPILDKHGIHSDFLYLACIESYLSPTAKSPAGAVGIWQFMPGTAKNYGLEVNDEVDERYDPEIETVAACKYLKSSYRKYGNWESVAASYNAGPAKISKELESQMQTSAFDLWLVEETQRYPFRMMAMKMILENPTAYGFKLNENQLYQPYAYTVVTVDGPVADWPTWAKEQGIDYATLRTYNPWIRAKKLTNKAGKAYKVRIPTKESLKRVKTKYKTFNPAWINQNK